MLIIYISWDARHEHAVLAAPSPPKEGPAAAGCAYRDSFARAFFRSVRMAAQPYVSSVCSERFHNSVMSPKHPQPGSFPLKWDLKDEMQERRWPKPPPSQFPASPKRILSALTTGTWHRLTETQVLNITYPRIYNWHWLKPLPNRLQSRWLTVTLDTETPQPLTEAAVSINFPVLPPPGYSKETERFPSVVSR